MLRFALFVGATAAINHAHKIRMEAKDIDGYTTHAKKYCQGSGDEFVPSTLQECADKCTPEGGCHAFNYS